MATLALLGTGEGTRETSVVRFVVRERFGCRECGVTEKRAGNGVGEQLVGLYGGIIALCVRPRCLCSVVHAAAYMT